ncbi:MAG: hypothetical protein WBP29_11910 [Candidatus Zixiibacteriota bacterium]
MSQSPVEFAAAFERLRSRISMSAGSDDVILLLIEFWPRIRQLGRNHAYSSYVAEYLSFLNASLEDEGFRDFSVDELKQLEMICISGGVAAELILQIRKQIARLCFYVGELSEGLQACLRITNEQLKNDCELGFDANLSEFERFRTLVDSVGDAAPNTRSILVKLLEDWQSEREFVSTDRIHCLFVQNRSLGDAPRGKLRTLTGSVEERGSHSENDEVTFDNQLRAADDPIVGVAYQALTAVRTYLKATGYTKLGSQYYHAHFAVAEREATYTGDSIGIATALLAYAQLLHTQALRHDHQLPGDVACTGGIDESGKITPVNGDSLRAKVERAFFSHIKYLVLPAANLAQAAQYLETLLREFPERQLILVPVDSLSAVINDHNIIRPEKICIGEFVAKKAVTYSRMTKVQVPMLLVLAYLLLSVIYPKAWIGFDWNPASVRIAERRMEVVNRADRGLWAFEFPDQIINDDGTWEVADIDNDGQAEVIILPSQHGLSSMGGLLHIFDSDGRLISKVDCTIRGEYPGDTIAAGNPIPLETADLYVSDYLGRKIIITCQNAQYPARCYIRFWETDGKPMGRYINSGYTGLLLLDDLDGDGSEEALFRGANNRLGCQAIFDLNPETANGVSPPYDAEHGYDLTAVVRGNQEHYVLLYPSDLNKFAADPGYCGVKTFRVHSGSSMQITTIENSNPDFTAGVDYFFNANLRLQRASFDDGQMRWLEILQQEGKLPSLPANVFIDTTMNRVTYFSGDKYITEGQLRSAEASQLNNSPNNQIFYKIEQQRLFPKLKVQQ